MTFILVRDRWYVACTVMLKAQARETICCHMKGAHTIFLFLLWWRLDNGLLRLSICLVIYGLVMLYWRLTIGPAVLEIFFLFYVDSGRGLDSYWETLLET